MITFRLAALLALGWFISGCSGSEDDDLVKWMAEQKTQTKPRVTPIPEPKKFIPQSYGQVAAVEPFSREKLTLALRRDSAQVVSNAALVAPELARRKEPLEAFPLDSMSLVGSLIKTGKPVALVKVDNLLYQVRPGNHLGQNYGLVTKVSETTVTLREIVQDAVGEWIERTATLQLQEGTK